MEAGGVRGPCGGSPLLAFWNDRNLSVIVAAALRTGAILTFTVYQVVRAQKALRSIAKLPDEEFPIQLFIGMLSEEIQALRNRGNTDREIAIVINGAAGVNIEPSDVTQYYVPPKDRKSAVQSSPPGPEKSSRARF